MSRALLLAGSRRRRRSDAGGPPTPASPAAAVVALQRSAGNAAVARTVAAGRSRPRGRMAARRVQRFDWMHNRRKVGVEITEDTAGGNALAEQAGTPVWTGVVNKAAEWTHTVNLPDDAGAAHTWYMTPLAAANPAHFAPAGAKHRWMKWGVVNLTEDHGDIEWITDHPAQPAPVSEYRTRLTAVATARAAVRTALAGATPNPAAPAPAPALASPYLLSKTVNGAAQEVILLSQAAANQASSQITVEAGDTDATRRGLLEGLAKGLDSDQAIPMSQRAQAFGNAPAFLTAAVNTAAGRLALPGIDARLICAYVMADLCHKAVTAFGGVAPGDWANAASNFKSWRTLFPKSHPSQILLQAMGARLPTPADLMLVDAALGADAANMVADVLGLVAQRLQAQRVQPLFGWMDLAAGQPEHQRIQTTMLTGAYPGGGPGLAADISAFLDWGRGTANWLTLEHAQTVRALTDLTAASTGVVKSGGFAVHTGASKGFAFEDRAEVVTQFPNLGTTYDRLVVLVDRY